MISQSESIGPRSFWNVIRKSKQYIFLRLTKSVLWLNLFQSLTDTARVMNQEIVNERRENQRTKIWQKKINFLLRLDPELFTSKPPSIRKRTVVTSAQQTKVWNRKFNDLLRLGSELFTSALMTASSRQKKKKQLIIRTRVRQNQKQDQNQEQRNNVISITGQSGRCMRIRRAPKRFY